MASSLPNLVNNFAAQIHKSKWKDCDSFLVYKSVKDNLIKCKYLSYNKDYSKKLSEKFEKRFKNTFKFFENDINKFFVVVMRRVLSLSIDKWEKFNETTLPEKEEVL